MSPTNKNHGALVVPNTNTVKTFKKLPKNTRGRDFVIGDLHGCRSELERSMDRICFNFELDRILSVGDLVNRGPEPLRTLELLREPWFHAVISNHESMLLTFLNKTTSSYHRPNDFLRNGGMWLGEPTSKDQKDNITSLAELVLDLPLMLIVADDIPFNVMHGDMLPIFMNQNEIESTPEIPRHDADASVWSRDLIYSAANQAMTTKKILGTKVRIHKNSIVDNLNITFVGHTIMEDIVAHESHVFIDQGAYKLVKDDDKRYGLTMLEARPFCESLTSAVHNIRNKSKTIFPKALNNLKSMAI